MHTGRISLSLLVISLLSLFCLPEVFAWNPDAGIVGMDEK